MEVLPMTVNDQLTKSVNQPDGETESSSDDKLAKLRLRSSWFDYMTICSLFVSNVFIIPWRFVYDSKSESYKVIAPLFQRVMFLLTHSIGFIVLRFHVLGGFHYVRTSTDDFRYFDLMSLLGMYAFALSSDVIWWTKIHKIQAFVEELQTSPLLGISSQRALRKSSFLFTIFILYCFAVVFFFCHCWGLGDWDTAGFLKIVKTTAEDIFGVEENSWKNSILYPPLLVFSFLANIQNALMMHFNDMMSISTITLLYNISLDLQRAIKDGSLSDEKVLELIEAQKRLTIKFNNCFGLACCLYSLYGSPYYAIHLIDILSVPGSLDRFINAVYLTFLTYSLWAGIQINKMAKQHKKWMWRNNRMLQIPHQQLAIFIDDIEWERFGPGTFFVLDNGMAGEVLYLILTLAVITIQLRGH